MSVFIPNRVVRPNTISPGERDEMSDVVSTKPKNNCPDCQTRVETYIKSVQEFQGHIDRLTLDRDNLSQSFFKLQQSASDGIIALEEKLRVATKKVSSLRKTLSSCKAAMKYAYEDHADQYYLNVLNLIEATEGQGVIP